MVVNEYLGLAPPAGPDDAGRRPHHTRRSRPRSRRRVRRPTGTARRTQAAAGQAARRGRAALLRGAVVRGDRRRVGQRRERRAQQHLARSGPASNRNDRTRRRTERGGRKTIRWRHADEDRGRSARSVRATGAGRRCVPGRVRRATAHRGRAGPRTRDRIGRNQPGGGSSCRSWPPRPSVTTGLAVLAIGGGGSTRPGAGGPAATPGVRHDLAGRLADRSVGSDGDGGRHRCDGRGDRRRWHGCRELVGVATDRGGLAP